MLDALFAWRDRLSAELGDEGRKAFTTITRRYGLRLQQPIRDVVLSPEEAGVLGRFVEALGQRRHLADAWRADDDGLDDDDFVAVAIGKPDRAALERVAGDYEEQLEGGFPPLLHALWSKANGVSVYTTREPPGEVLASVDSLDEPGLWPAETYGEHFLDTDDDRLFAIGEIPDSGYVALRPRPEAQPDVVWLADGRTTVIAPSLAAYLEAWAGAAFRIQAVLRRARVPGWGG
jgi:hypothetical protein